MPPKYTVLWHKTYIYIYKEGDAALGGVRRLKYGRKLFLLPGDRINENGARRRKRLVERA